MRQVVNRLISGVSPPILPPSNFPHTLTVSGCASRCTFQVSHDWKFTPQVPNLFGKRFFDARNDPASFTETSPIMAVVNCCFGEADGTGGCSEVDSSTHFWYCFGHVKILLALILTHPITHPHRRKYSHNYLDNL
jgi:hypothetical protein